MPLLRVLIVDDEPLARERLRRLLEAATDVEVVGECGSGTEAKRRLNKDGVDVLFIDMEMPGASGLNVLQSLPEAKRPVVVFATAHENFALDAFDQQAVDYLLKPFDQERFGVALGRARDAVKARAGTLNDAKFEGLIAQVTARESRSERLTFKVDGRMIFLKAKDVLRVEAADNYVVLHVADGARHMVRETMTALEKRLGPTRFVRVNRSAIVQVDHIKELQPSAHGDYTIVLADGNKLPLSRSLRGKLDTLFGPGAD